MTSLSPLRNSLLKEPLEFFRRLRDQFDSSRDTRPEATARLATATYDVALTTREMRSETDAIPIMEDAANILGRLVEEHPSDVRFQVELARSHLSLGSWSWDSNDRATALRSLLKSKQLWEQLGINHPDEIEFQRGLARCHLGEFWLWVETDLPKARALIEAAQAIYNKLTHEHPESLQFQNELAELHYHKAARVGLQGR